MSEAYWQAKIWGLLHDPAVKALHDDSGHSGNSFWQQLEVMQDWVENKPNPEESHRIILEHIHLADYISSASDRASFSPLGNYPRKSLGSRKTGEGTCLLQRG